MYFNLYSNSMREVQSWSYSILQETKSQGGQDLVQKSDKAGIWIQIVWFQRLFLHPSHNTSSHLLSLSTLSHPLLISSFWPYHLQPWVWPALSNSTPHPVGWICPVLSCPQVSGTDLIGSSTIMELRIHGRKLGKSFGKKALIYLFICHSNFIELSLSTKHCSSPRGIQNDLQSPSLQET